MQRKYKAGLITKEEWNVIEQKWKEFEQRWDLLPINTSNYSKPEDNIEQLDDYDEEQQALLKWLYVPRKNSNTANNTKDTSVITYDDDKKLAKKISKWRKEEELKRKEEEQKSKVLSEDDEMRRRRRVANNKWEWLSNYKLPKRTSKVITLRHDDEDIAHTACFFRLNSKKRIRLFLYFESLKWDKDAILSKLEKNKLGIYVLINNKNNKFYIGSSANLPQRMKYYMRLDIKKTFKEDNLRTIEKAITKHGLENFSLGIIWWQDHYWFRKSDNWKKKVLDAEQEAIDGYHPHYNDVKASRIPLED